MGMNSIFIRICIDLYLVTPLKLPTNGAIDPICTCTLKNRKNRVVDIPVSEFVY
jgi:hypothetical protein